LKRITLGDCPLCWAPFHPPFTLFVQAWVLGLHFKPTTTTTLLYRQVLDALPELGRYELRLGHTQLLAAAFAGMGLPTGVGAVHYLPCGSSHAVTYGATQKLSVCVCLSVCTHACVICVL
jgi:hypothetical protein